MKKYLWLCLIPIFWLPLLLGADLRNDAKRPIVRYTATQLSWASGETDTQTVLFKGNPSSMDPNYINGLVESFSALASNATNGITFTTTFKDSLGSTIKTITGIPENANTYYNGLDTDTTFNAFSSAGPVTATVAPSGDPGASGVTFDFHLEVK